MSTKLRISQNETKAIALVSSVMRSAAEIFMEGGKLSAKGERMLNKAYLLMEKWDISDEELGIYVKGQYEPNQGTAVYSKFKGLMQ